MREIIFDLIVFAVGMSLGVVLASFMFERKRKEVMDLVDVSLDTVGIKRSEFNEALGNFARLEKLVEIHDELLKRFELNREA